jgi:hypothetical protein
MNQRTNEKLYTLYIQFTNNITVLVSRIFLSFFYFWFDLSEIKNVWYFHLIIYLYQIRPEIKMYEGKEKKTQKQATPKNNTQAG